jgi:hypothetical protein
MNLYERMIATQKTVDLWKGRPFNDGTGDCVQLMKAHARHMGRQLRIPAYRNTKEAAAALRKMGHKSLSGALDAHFRRIEPNEILLSDIVEVPGQNGFSSLMIALGNGRALGFHEELPHADVLQPVMISGAWRIEAKDARTAAKPPQSSRNASGTRSGSRNRLGKS